MSSKPLSYTPITVNARSNIVTATERQQATALCLAVYCGEHRNGGIIPNCRSWTRKQWSLACGVRGVPQDCSLYRWVNNDLQILVYDQRAEERANARSAAGRKANEVRWAEQNKLPTVTKMPAVRGVGTPAPAVDQQDYASPEDIKSIL